MFIQTESTPNPDTIKFLPGQDVTGGQGVEILTLEIARKVSPLAVRLFDVEGVRSVFLGSDFVSVTRVPETDWAMIRTLVLGVLFEHFSRHEPVLLSGGAEDASSSRAYNGPDKEIVAQICEILDSRVRPAVARDGGDIEFHAFEKGILWLRMRGACAGCPSSSMTLKAGIENMMRHYIPQVLEVRAVE